MRKLYANNMKMKLDQSKTKPTRYRCTFFAMACPIVLLFYVALAVIVVIRKMPNTAEQCRLDLVCAEL